MLNRGRVLGVAVLVCVFASLALADQPNMRAARTNLQQARAQLQYAANNKGGHRVKAIDHVNRAIGYVNNNVGHLLDLETLVSGRVDEYLAGAETLHAADISNRKTYEADHNERAMAAILTDFRTRRMQLVDCLDNLAPETFALVAHHPRLNTSMRLVDMLFFQAEHDDYHLARISELIRLFS